MRLPNGGSHLTKSSCSKLSDEEFEKVLLDKWSHARKKEENEKHVRVIFYWYLLIAGSWIDSEGEDHCVYKS
jgi:hypothetical protein